MIPTYNCDEYLGQTLESVLAQYRPDMQIEVVDDCSTEGDPEAVVARLGGGRVAFHRQAVNVGHTRNFNTCLRRARGELVHLLHGDDLVLDDFYDRVGRHFGAAPETGAVICRHAIVDDAGDHIALGHLLRSDPGPLDGWLALIGAGQLVQPPAVVVRRSVYEQVGGYDERIAGYGEDWEMLVRVAAVTTVVYEPEVLAAYRSRPGSLSAPNRVRSNMADMRFIMLVNRVTMRARLPEAEVRAIDRAARISLSGALLRRADRAVRNESHRVSVRTLAQTVGEAVRIQPLLPVVKRGAGILVRGSLAAVRRRARRAGAAASGFRRSGPGRRAR